MSDKNVDSLISPFLNFYTIQLTAQLYPGNTVTAAARLLKTAGEKR